MKRTLLAACMLSPAVALFGVTPADLLVSPPILPLAIRIQQQGMPFFEPVESGFEISPEQRVHLDKAVLWSWMSVGGFGANALGLIIAQTADSSVGGLLSLLSVGFWTVSNMLNALALRDLGRDMDYHAVSSPRPTAAGLAALVAGLFGSITLTAVSLSFGDATGITEPFAYVCIALSSIAGGYGVYKTFEYAEAAGIKIDFF